MACLASVTKLFLQLLHPHYKVSLLGAKPLKHLPLMVNIPMTSAYGTGSPLKTRLPFISSPSSWNDLGPNVNKEQNQVAFRFNPRPILTLQYSHDSHHKARPYPRFFPSNVIDPAIRKRICEACLLLAGH